LQKYEIIETRLQKYEIIETRLQTYEIEEGGKAEQKLRKKQNEIK